jgi:signal transduction histidine kinase
LLSNNEHLLGMVNQLLETYQFESGQLRLIFQSVHLPDLVAESFSKLLSLATLRCITLDSEFPADFPMITGDAGCLSRVFINLIGNAIENIPKGCHIKVSGRFNAKMPDTIEIHVRDNGQGLSQQIVHTLFDRYAAGTGDTRKLGSGLGLYICKMFIEAHGGHIEADSIPGSHTDFIIRLPIHSKAKG